MNLSFRAKHPISHPYVFDKEQQKFVETTLYEIDCKDKKDISYIKKQPGNWGYLRDEFIESAKCKNLVLKMDGKSNNTFYSLENSKGNSIGFMEIRDGYKRRNLFLFVCNPDKKYKFVGQVMLSEAAKEILGKKHYVFTVDDPTDEGRNFYINNCGFKKQYKGSHGLKLTQNGIKKFIDDVKKRTQMSEIDIIT